MTSTESNNSIKQMEASKGSSQVSWNNFSIEDSSSNSKGSGQKDLAKNSVSDGFMSSIASDAAAKGAAAVVQSKEAGSGKPACSGRKTTPDIDAAASMQAAAGGAQKDSDPHKPRAAERPARQHKPAHRQPDPWTIQKTLRR